MGTTYLVQEWGGSLLTADLHGTLRTRTAEMSGGLGTQKAEGSCSVCSISGWSALTWNLSRHMAVVVGTEYRPGRDAGPPWRFSLGIRRKLVLPMPIPQRPAVAGTVFQDLNGNGERDAGEPGLPGVLLVWGNLEIPTDSHGSFAIAADTEGSAGLSVNVASLPEGMMLLPGVATPSSGRVSIPVVRASSLELRLSLEHGQGSAAGARVRLVSRHGRQRTAIANRDGIATLTALIPGTYTVAVEMPSVDHRTRAEHSVEIELFPGQQEVLELTVPRGALEIRFSAGSTAAGESEFAEVERPTPDFHVAEAAASRPAEAIDRNSAPGTHGRGADRSRAGESRLTPSQEAARVYSEMLGRRTTQGTPPVEQLLRHFDSAYAPRYLDTKYAAEVRARVLEMIQRIALGPSGG
jgi:hypothetical protein